MNTVLLMLIFIGTVKNMVDASKFKADVALLQETVALVANGFVVVKDAIKQLREDINGGAKLSQEDLDALDNQVTLMTDTLAKVAADEKDAASPESGSAGTSESPGSETSPASGSEPAPTE